MISVPFRTALVAAMVLTISAAHAQPQPSASDPVIKNANPATSPTTDDDGNNPMARAGENSPTGQGPSIHTNAPIHGTVGIGPRNQAQEQSPNRTSPPQADK